MTEKVDSKPESLIGTTVGDYKIIDIIGQGGMGVVYTAEHTQLHHQTACKVLRAEMASHPETVERFLQEAKFISRIRHLNLIDIFDIGELPDRRLYYVMEKLTGRTLAQVLQGQKLSFASILAVTNQICAGLAAAHAAGLVHRDRSPNDITRPCDTATSSQRRRIPDDSSHRSQFCAESHIPITSAAL